MKKTETGFNRRTFLKGSAVGVGMLAAPAIISHKALASSGELNFMGWAGYPGLAETVFPAFEAATGIKVNFNEQPDQDAMFAQAKLALQTGGTDVVEITTPAVVVGPATITPSSDGLSLELDLDGDGDSDLTITNVEELVLNGERVVISGDLSRTGLAPNTITYVGSELDNTLDASGLTSVESIRAQGLDGNDTLISAGDDDTLEGGDVELEELSESVRKAFMCYLFLATVQELIIQHLDSSIIES